MNITKRPLINIFNNTCTISVYHNNLQKRFNSVCNKKISENDKPNIEKPPAWERALPFETIPGPKPIPILGNSWRFFPLIGNYHGKNILELYKQLQNEYGNILKIEAIAGRPPTVFLFSPEDVEHVCRNEGDKPFRNGLESLEYYQKVLRKDIFKGNGSLSTLQGDEWYRMRSQVNPTLMQPQIVSQYIPQMDIVSKDFINKVNYLLGKSKNSELPNDFLNEIYRWSLEIACLVSLNSRLGCLNLNESVNDEAQNLINAVVEMFDLLFELNVLPSLWRKISTPKFKKFVRTMDYLTSVCIKYIDKAEKQLKNSNSQSSSANVFENLLKIDKNTALIMAMDVILAGIDTTGKTAAALMYFLATNEDKQDQLRKELLEAIPDPTISITRQILDQMPYLRACIKESMRIASVTPGQNRVLSKDIILSGYQIPKGTEILMGTLYMCNCKEYYPEPDKYMPERWLRNSSLDISVKKTHPFVYLPFGYGPRSCLGRRLAFTELEVLIATMFRKYKFEWHHEPMKFESRLLYSIARPLNSKLIPLY